MTARKAISRAVLLTAVSILAALGGASAAYASDLPDDVSSWFADEAVPIVLEIQAGSVVLDTGVPETRYTDVSLGTPHQLHTWTPEFRGGTRASEVSTPIDQWVAPLLDRGEPVGTIHAHRNNDGLVELAYFDDHVSLATRLLSTGDAEIVVYDPPLDAFFGMESEQIRPLSDTARSEVAGRASVEDFQQLLAERYAGDDLTNVGLPSDDPRAAMAGGGGGVPTDPTNGANSMMRSLWIGVGGVGLACASGVLLYRVRKDRRSV